MDFFTFYGFNGRAVTEGRSFVALGERQLDPALSLSDDATDPRQLPVFDAEGTPKRRVPLVEAGVITAVTHDRRSAAQAGGGATTTGHAVAGGEASGAVATATVLGPASARGPRPVASLISEVGRGLLVSDFWYTRVLDPKTLVATGLTRNGVFLIEKGEVGRAVSNLRFTQSYVAALAPGQVLAWVTTPGWHPAAFTSASITSPAFTWPPGTSPATPRPELTARGDRPVLTGLS